MKYVVCIGKQPMLALRKRSTAEVLVCLLIAARRLWWRRITIREVQE